MNWSDVIRQGHSLALTLPSALSNHKLQNPSTVGYTRSPRNGDKNCQKNSDKQNSSYIEKQSPEFTKDLLVRTT